MNDFLKLYEKMKISTKQFPLNTDRETDWRADSSGNEGNARSTDLEGPNSDSQMLTSSSPPKESKDTPNDKRKTLFRTASNTPNSANIKKKQSLSFSSEPRSIFDACLSPTNVEPRKSLLDQLSRTFATEESQLPNVVALIGPQEPYSGPFYTQRLTSVLSSTIRPSFLPHNTAEVKAILQSLMNKIQK